MKDEKEKIIEEQIPQEAPAEALVSDTEAPSATPSPKDRRELRKNPRKPSRREPKAKQEFDNKLLEIRRVARVIAGGRRFSFSASIVVGDRKGKVGVGIGKASDTPIAIEKAIRDAKKNMITVSLTPTSSIRHEISGKYGSSVIKLVPSPGKGVIAGSSARSVLSLAGVNAVSAKILSRSKNKINNARATVEALGKLNA